MRGKRGLIVGAVIVAALAVWMMVRSGGAGDASATPNADDAASGSTAANSDDRTTSSALRTSGAASPASARAAGQLWVTVHSPGGPLAAARVSAFLQGPQDPNTEHRVWTRLGSDVTGDDGIARLAVPAGVYRLAVAADGFGTAHRVVTVLSRETRTDVELTLAPALSLTGRVVEKGSGQPLPLAEVRVQALPETAELFAAAGLDGPAEDAATAISDPQGRFRVDSLAAGWFRVEAHAAGHAQGVAERVVVPRSSELVLSLPVAAVIQGFVRDPSGAPAAGAEVSALGSGAPVSGTTGSGGGFALEVAGGTYSVVARRGGQTAAADPKVTVAGGLSRTVELRLSDPAAISGFVRDARGPIAGAIVSVSPYNATGDLGRALSAADGSYRVTGLPPGSYDVVADAAEHGRMMKRAITVRTAEEAKVDLQLGHDGGIEGRVLDDQGSPIVGALIAVGALGDEGLSDGPPASRSDANGHYAVDGIEPGGTLISVVRSPGAAPQTFTTRIPTGAVAHLDLALRSTGTVHGSVTGAPPDSASSVVAMAPQPGLGPGGGSQRARVAADGTFTLELPAGHWRLRAFTSGDHFVSSAPVDAEVKPNETVEVTLPIDQQPDNTLSCQLFDADGSPAVGASVWIPGQDFEAADESGKATLTLRRPPPSGKVQLHARIGGRSATISDQAVDRPCVVRLSPSGRVEGTVIGLTADASFELRASATEAEGWSTVQARTGATFVLSDVPAGQVQLDVQAQDGRTATMPVEVSTGATTRVEIPLGAGIQIRGRVVDAASNGPVADAQVVVDRGWQHPTPVSGDGRFEVSVSGPGDHELRIWVPGRMFATRKVTVGDGPVEVGDVPVAARVDPGQVGLSLGAAAGPVTVSEVTPGGPASRAGVMAGDLVLAVDGTAVRDNNDAVARIKGAPGTAVTLGLRRGSVDQTVVVIRAQ